MRLIVTLYVLIAVTHYAPDHIGKLYGDPAQAARAWFYVLRGIEGALLFTLPVLMRRWLVPSFSLAAVLTWGALEEAMTAACRLSKPIDTLPGFKQFSGLCGDDWYLAGCCTALVIGAIILDHGRKK